MSELVADMEDWSLQAIVRGSSGEFGKIVDYHMDDQSSFFDRDFVASFPEFFDVSNGSGDELEELYKPFYTAAAPLPVQDPTVQERNVPEDKPPSDQSDQSSGSGSVASVTPAYTPKYKKRKNQHKRVVIQVSAEGLSSDMWAWRKYGQKPIKGSPYPRSYYRCSSSKGCLARKQVEQSCTDPGMFIVTYTAEHSHSKPTRRNSLAGTVRQKFPSPKSQNGRTVKQENTENPISPASYKQVEADIPLTRIKEENKEDKETRAEGERQDDNDLDMSDFVFDEDLFSGLQDFDDFLTEMPASAQKFPVRSCSWF